MSEQADYNKRWWEVDESEMHESLFGIMQFLKQNQSWREQLNLRNLRLYGDFKNLGLTANTYAQSDQSYNSYQNRLTLNIIKSICDTAYNKIAKSKPRPIFLTEGGNESKQRKAKLLSKFVEGVFYAGNAYSAARKAFLDASVFGTGCIKVYREGQKICYERVFINELKVDEAEAIYGEPRQLFQTRACDINVLKAQFPDKVDLLDDAADTMLEQKGYQKISDQVTVVEAWHLPSGKDSGDGRHVISVNTGILLDEPWEKEHFPFVFMKWSERLLGFWGYGIAEGLTGIQYEINSLLQTIQMSMRLCSIPKVFVETGSKIVPAHLNNDIGGIIFYSGTPPRYEAIQAVPPELFAQVDRLVQKAYDITGVSTFTAQARKPAGLNSGVAIREFEDIQSERFAVLQQQFEEFVMEMASQSIELAQEIYEEYGEFDVTVASNKELEKISWKEVNLDKESYMMKIYPTSALPQSPAGKLEKVVELYQNGFIPQEVAFSLLEFPDIEQASNRILADYNDIQNTIEGILEGKKYYPPEPYQNLELGIREMQRAYLNARRENISEDKKQKMRDWMTQAENMIKKLSQPPAPAPLDAMAGGLPPLPGGVPGGLPPEGVQLAPSAQLPPGDLAPLAGAPAPL